MHMDNGHNTDDVVVVEIVQTSSEGGQFIRQYSYVVAYERMGSYGYDSVTKMLQHSSWTSSPMPIHQSSKWPDPIRENLSFNLNVSV